MLCCPQVHKFLNRVGRSGFLFFFFFFFLLNKKKKKRDPTFWQIRVGRSFFFQFHSFFFLKVKKKTKKKQNATRPQHIYFFFGLIAHA